MTVATIILVAGNRSGIGGVRLHTVVPKKEKGDGWGYSASRAVNESPLAIHES